jgi:hypothetical protein
MLADNGDSGQNRAARAVTVLRAWGLAGLAAALLEHGGALNFFGAQALHFAAPVLDGLGPGTFASDLADVLEDPAAARALAAALSAPEPPKGMA